MQISLSHTEQRPTDTVALRDAVYYGISSTHRVLCLLAHDNSGCCYSLLCLLTFLDGIPHYTRLWLTVLCPAINMNQSEVVLDDQTNRVVGQ